MEPNEPIPLSHEERQLFDQICWDLVELGELDGPTRAAHLEMAGLLADSLLRRSAIPTIRLAYFTDPKMLVGGRGRSRQARFERNGTRGRAIFRHGHSIPILRYFICGPELPAETVRRLAEAIADCRGGRPALQRRLRAIVRNELRSRGQSQFHFADQLFQAAHELGFGDLARFLRSAALAFRG